MKILVIDDHPIVRTGIKFLLNDQFKNPKVTEAGSGTEALNIIMKNEYDIILLDVSMRDLNGLELLKTLKKRKPGLPILVLSIHPEEHYAVRMIKKGALGYLTKDSAPEQLKEAIVAVMAGKNYYSAAVEESLSSGLAVKKNKPLHAYLSNREYMVMCGIALGKKNQLIAAEHKLSPKTISTYRERLLKKLQMKSNAEVTRYAVRANLI